MPSILIGVHVHAEPQRLAQTLAGLSAHTSPPHDLLLLGDGPDNETARFLQESRIEQSCTDGPRGVAACFNRLLHHRRADVYVLLESGALPSPGWLGQILAAMERTPRCGLAGPSTNRAWNQQGVFPMAGGREEDIVTIARTAVRRFGALCRTLEPLYSLAEFCYAVKRQVAEAIGDADEAYGLGPCWEMDYNIRAQRAGHLGLWVCGAYVYRSPATARRARDEEAHFEASKRRYQDKFCGLRLQGLKQDYRPHCRGDACRNFAPAGLIQLQPPSRALPAVETLRQRPRPLVSCVLPTYNRRAFLPRSLRCFLAQDYPNLELVVVDDGSDKIADLLPRDERVRYFPLEQKLILGAKRNFACARARGDYILHWDDDEWYPPHRVTRQIDALQDSQAQICGTSVAYFYAHASRQAFCYRFRGPNPTWMGIMAYPRSTWQRHPFEPIAVAEDVKFLCAIPAQARLDLKNPELSVASIHPDNTSPKITNGTFWTQVPVETLPYVDELPVMPPGSEPQVTCIMPTMNRRPFIPLALACFQSQTLANKELIVVDDGDDPVGDLVRHLPAVRYLRLARRMTIGGKRNLACEKATGEFIAHWDDDDWYSPNRLARQLESLQAERCDLAGLTNRYVLQMPGGSFWNTTQEVHRRMFVGDIVGGTLLYRRSLWLQGIRYPEASLAEDAGLIRRAISAGKRVLRQDNAGLFVYLRHGHNTWKFESGRFVDPKGWSAVSPPEGFSQELLESYRAASLAAADQRLPAAAPLPAPALRRARWQ